MKLTIERVSSVAISRQGRKIHAQMEYDRETDWCTLKIPYGATVSIPHELGHCELRRMGLSDYQQRRIVDVEKHYDWKR